MTATSQLLRSRLNESGIIVAPGAYDTFSALLVQAAGFPAVYMTGNGQGASLLGMPDLGLITLSEMCERVRHTRAVVNIPLIVDADEGYGTLLTLKRAVAEFEQAGADAIQIEDQVAPKKCGHEGGREIVSTAEMLMRLRAACDARRDPNTVLIARTDARTSHGLGEAIQRANAYLKGGADVIFVESPESEAEFAEVARSVRGPVLANMVETGRSPYLSWRALDQMGLKIAIYPVTSILAAGKAVQTALNAIRQEGSAAGLADSMLSLHEYHDTLGFYSRLEDERRLRSGSE